MSDKSWMLNPRAIRQAKQCISLTKNVAGVKLKLSQPDFIQVLEGCVQQSGSSELDDAYSRLMEMASVGDMIQSIDPNFDAAAAASALKGYSASA